MEPRLEQYLAEQHLSDQTLKVVPLTGDASDRRYFRVLLKNAKPIVLALHAGPIDYAAMPFVGDREAAVGGAAAGAARSCIIRIRSACSASKISATSRCRRTSAPPRRPNMPRSIARRSDFIARMQQRGEALRSDAYPPYRIAFDVEKLTWELEFFVKHYLLGLQGRDAGRRASATRCREEWSAIVDELAAEPRVLCHRDYHSRNLMLHDGSLYIIDFQDARMGPDTYDLASLLRDSYVDLNPQQVDGLIAFFLAHKSGDRARTTTSFGGGST